MTDAPEPGTLPLLPWEDPAETRGALARALDTAGRILNQTAAAGETLGNGAGVGAPIRFFALLGLPFGWLAAVNAQLTSLAHPERQAALFRWLHMPEPPAPTAQQLAFAKVFGFFQLALYPLMAALGLLLAGVLVHGGLWATRALGRGRGLETTYRVLLYTAGSTGWMTGLLSFGLWLPGRVHWPLQLLLMAVSLAILTLQGRVQAAAHGVESWRGILGVFLPLIVLACVGGCCLGLVAGLVASAGLK